MNPYRQHLRETKAHIPRETKRDWTKGERRRTKREGAHFPRGRKSTHSKTKYSIECCSYNKKEDIVRYGFIGLCCKKFSLHVACSTTLNFWFTKSLLFPKSLMLEAMLRVLMLWSLTCYTWMSTHLWYFYYTYTMIFCCSKMSILLCHYTAMMSYLLLLLSWRWLSFAIVDHCMDCILHWLLTEGVMIYWVHWLDNCRVLFTPVQNW